MALSIPLAVEKTLYRIAILNEGAVPIARLFLELPLSLEEVEEHADKVADGHSVVKNEWGDFLTYEFPELQRQMPQAPTNCPVCGGDAPPACTEGGEEVRSALVCASCYKKVRTLHQEDPQQGRLDKIKEWFRGEVDEDFVAVAQTEHEIFYLGLRLGMDQFTHTSIAAQSGLPSNQIKERLDRMAARRYIQVGLLPSGDAVAYRFPPELTYPEPHYQRLTGKRSQPGVEIDAEERDDGVGGGAVPRPPVKPVIKSKKPRFNIVIKAKRNRDAEE